MTRRFSPGGAQPYSPETISRSVPQTPSAKRAHQDCAVGARRLWNVFKPHRTGNARRNCDCAHGALREFGPQIEVQWRTGPRPLGQVALLQRNGGKGFQETEPKVPVAGTRWNPLVEPALPLRCGARRHILIFHPPRSRIMDPIGHKRWAIAEGYIPSQSSFSDRTLISHETACILNANDSDAHVRITLFFADREPVTYQVKVGGAAHTAFALQRSGRSVTGATRHRLFFGV